MPDFVTECEYITIIESGIPICNFNLIMYILALRDLKTMVISEQGYQQLMLHRRTYNRCKNGVLRLNYDYTL